jgi:hypothetical protein
LVGSPGGASTRTISYFAPQFGQSNVVDGEPDMGKKIPAESQREAPVLREKCLFGGSGHDGTSVKTYTTKSREAKLTKRGVADRHLHVRLTLESTEGTAKDLREDRDSIQTHRRRFLNDCGAM